MNNGFQFLSDLIQENPWPIAKHVFIIGEIGINHNGDLGITKQLIDMAKEAGCDAVKFQKRTIDIVYSKEVLDSPRESPWGKTQRAQKEGLEFGKREYDEIDAYCKKFGIEWFASAWDVESQHFMRQYNLKYNKIASPMMTHLDLLEAVAQEKKLTFISTGMSTYEDIDRAVEIFRNYDCPFVLMHCISAYPVPEEALNLKCIVELRKKYQCPVGYSGHEVTMVPGVLAAMMGAVAIERHITLDRAMYGSDQAASLEKRGLEMMVGYVRTIPTVMGDGIKRVLSSELANAKKLRYWTPSNGEKPSAAPKPQKV
ncbi:MAG: N-acetylneuraminate synthase family protein [Chlamydiae bacterium]|nr:N-acetylneuraminate synthase family protein [Chlamydiota bacterium]MBI3276242.1 N-acetylneuraminate synthase family protein [Chlamydiota bacterium]